MELPNSIEQMLTISIDTDEPFCSNGNKRNEVISFVYNLL